MPLLWVGLHGIQDMTVLSVMVLALLFKSQQFMVFCPGGPSHFVRHDFHANVSPVP